MNLPFQGDVVCGRDAEPIIKLFAGCPRSQPASNERVSGLVDNAALLPETGSFHLTPFCIDLS